MAFQSYLLAAASLRSLQNALQCCYTESALLAARFVLE